MSHEPVDIPIPQVKTLEAVDTKSLSLLRVVRAGQLRDLEEAQARRCTSLREVLDRIDQVLAERLAGPGGRGEILTLGYLLRVEAGRIVQHDTVAAPATPPARGHRDNAGPIPQPGSTLRNPQSTPFFTED